MWMNEWEIDNALDRYREHPVLGPAVITLSDLRAITNNSSDGWPYWRKPANAAKRLMDLIEAHGRWERTAYQRPREGQEATAAALKTALAPVKAFRTRMIKDRTARYGDAQGWDALTITERLPTRREKLSAEIADCERTARNHATLTDRYLAKASDLAAELAELGEAS